MLCPRVPRCFSKAVVNGEFLPAPSRATFPGWVANAISEPTPVSSFANPRPTTEDRVPLERANVAASGLSRHASRKTKLTLALRSIADSTSSIGNASKSKSLFERSCASTGIK